MRRFKTALLPVILLTIVQVGPLVTPAAAATLPITLSPSSGTAGTSVTVGGSGFAARTGASLTFGKSVIRYFSTSNRGTFSVTITVPSGYSGATPVTVTAGADVGSSSFTVTSVTAPTTTTTTAPTTTTTAPATTTTTTPSTCSAPANLRVASTTSSTIGLAWDLVAGATIYDVYLAAAPGEPTSAYATGFTGTTATIFGLNSATTYTLAVRSNCGTVRSVNSNVVTQQPGGPIGGTTTTTTVAPAATAGSFVGRSGTSLTLDGVPRRFTGVNAYHLASDFTFNYGCGDNNAQADLDAVFSSLRPVSVVRVWGFQHLAYNKNTGAIDFSRIDRVVQTAERYGHKLIISLANQTGNCDTPAYKDEAWYAGGYRQVFNTGTYNGGASGPSTPLSFWDYLHQIVPRYANSPAVAIWQPVNEPRSAVVNADGSQTCTSTASSTLRQFFDVVGGEIHRLAPKQLVGSAVIGQGNCGTKGSEYQYLHASPGIDVGSYHDYNYDTSPISGDQWNGLGVRINQMNEVGKPLIIDEVGMVAGDNVAGCMTLAQRRDNIKAKMDAQLAQGIDMYLPWAWTKSTTNTCSVNMKALDPTLALIKAYPL